MAVTKEPTKLDTDQLRHEYFCLPQDGATEVRIEGFPYYEDAETGRSRPTRFVTRCVECGASVYRPI